ncbi:MAG: hypothetical protein WKH97_12500 [Casimicrobiaceae bacterium]
MKAAALCGWAAGCALTIAVAGPVEHYREGPDLCPRNRSAAAAPITEPQAIERARELLPRGFCGPSAFVSGCDLEAEFVLSAWRVYIHQFRHTAGGHARAGLAHTYLILDPVGNCLAHIPGTELGATS